MWELNRFSSRNSKNFILNFSSYKLTNKWQGLQLLALSVLWDSNSFPLLSHANGCRQATGRSIQRAE